MDWKCERAIKRYDYYCKKIQHHKKNPWKEATKRKNWTAPGIDGIKTSGGRVKTIKKGIEESIWTSQREQRLNTSLVAFRKNCAAPKNEKSNWREEISSDNVFEHV